MLRFAKVATPPIAATVAVPDNVPPPGFAATPIVMAPVKFVTVLPDESRAATWITGAITLPAIVVVGCCVKTSSATAAGVTLNAPELVASALVLNCSVYPIPARLMVRREKVATPATAVTVVAPESAPPIRFVPMVTVTSLVKLASVLPRASCAATRTAREIAAPAGVFVGCAITTSRVGERATRKSGSGSGLAPKDDQGLARPV